MNFVFNGNMDALKQVHVCSRSLEGRRARVSMCCLVNWGTGWGKMHVGKYFLCAFLSSRGLLTSVPVGYGAVQRSCT